MSLSPEPSASVSSLTPLGVIHHERVRTDAVPPLVAESPAAGQPEAERQRQGHQGHHRGRERRKRLQARGGGGTGLRTGWTHSPAERSLAVRQAWSLDAEL